MIVNGRLQAIRPTVQRAMTHWKLPLNLRCQSVLGTIFKKCLDIIWGALNGNIMYKHLYRFYIHPKNPCCIDGKISTTKKKLDCAFTKPFKEFQICIENAKKRKPKTLTEAAMLSEIQILFPFFPFWILCTQYLKSLSKIFTFSVFFLIFHPYYPHWWC